MESTGREGLSNERLEDEYSTDSMRVWVVKLGSWLYCHISAFRIAGLISLLNINRQVRVGEARALSQQSKQPLQLPAVNVKGISTIVLTSLPCNIGGSKRQY